MKDSKNPLDIIGYRLVKMEGLKDFLETREFRWFIVSLIILNATTIGLETSPAVMKAIGPWLEQIDKYILIIFCLEIALKITAYRLKFFTSAWNIFDFLIIGIALVPASGPLHILRTLRVLRTVRLIKNVPRLRMIIESLILSIPSIGWIMVLLFMIFYIFAVIGTDLYGSAFPQYFGDLGDSLFTLFQIMTLESWSSGIARPMMQQLPHSYLFFVPFILLATYTTLNVFIAVVVNTMNEVNRKELKEEEERLKELLKEEHGEIMDYMKKLNKKLDQLDNKIKDRNLIDEKE